MFPFIDYITLELMAVCIGLFVAAGFFWHGPTHPSARGYAAPFAIIGLLAGILGLVMTFTWPVPKPMHWANSAFGEPLTLFSVVLLATAACLYMGWSLRPVTVISFLSGLVAVDIGVCTGYFHLTQIPALTAIGFLVSGFAGLLTPLALWRDNLTGIRRLVSVLLVIAAVIWLFNALAGYFGHFQLWTSKPPQA